MKWFPVLLLAFTAPLLAAPVRTDHAEAELVAERTAWLAGAPNSVALRLKPQEGWHTYWRNPGDSGIPTKIEWTLPAGWSASEIQWPYPSVHRLGGLVNYGYGEETLHLVELQAPAKLGEAPVTVQATAKWLVCADICVPGTAALSLTLPTAEIATSDPQWSPRFFETRKRLPAADALAGTFAIEGGEVRVQVANAALAGAARADFFPFASDLINHGAPQRVELANGTLRLAQAQSASFTRAPTRVDGVVVVHGAGAQAYTVNATPGVVATVALAPVAAPAAAVPETRVLLALGLALLGGLILNLMPCVFPVLSIKAVSVLESRRGDPAAERAHALAYAAGVIGSCVSVAIALALLRSGGALLGWGFQLQSPVFVTVLAYVMFALGLSLSGLVQFGTSLMGVGQGLVEKGGYAGSFFTGVLAVIVASPCTAPFMGPALGYALTQPLLVSALIFAALGLGLALPFLLLGFVPALGAWLPRPGAWMETFKQFMAFPLYLSAVALLWVLGRQSSMDAVALALCGMVALGFAFWLWSAANRGPARTILAVLAFAAAAGVLAHPLIRTQSPPSSATATASHESFSEQRLAALRSQGRAVFINFTADWCITCKVNEKIVFENDAVKKAVAASGIVWMMADWTNPDPEITAALTRFGRSGVPLYVVYPKHGEPEILPQILTPALLIDAITKASRDPAVMPANAGIQEFLQ